VAKELKWVMYPTRNQHQSYETWRKLLEKLNVKVLEMTPDEHDKLAAYSQGLTHLIGRLLDECNIQSTPFDTEGFKRLLTIREQTCNDSWELFEGLQRYNPYTQEMTDLLVGKLNYLYAQFL